MTKEFETDAYDLESLGGHGESSMVRESERTERPEREREEKRQSFGGREVR